MKKSTDIFIISLLLFSLLLTGCRNDFNYAEDIVTSTESPRGPYPWENDQEFTYTESHDSIDNVINLTQNQTTNIQVSNGALHLMNPQSPIRYDPETNIQTNICADPLCEQGYECPFFMSSMNHGIYHVDDIYVYFKQTDDGIAVAKYSRTDRSVEILRTVESNRYNPQMAVLKDCYYYVAIAYNEETKVFTYSLCRQYYNTKKIEVLKKSNEYDFYILGADGDMVYYHDLIRGALVSYSATLKEEISSVDIGKDFYGVSICKDGYVIYIDEHGKLMRVNIDGTDKHSLGINNACFIYLTDSYIYYSVSLGVLTGKHIRENANGIQEETVFIEKQAIYRTDHEGNNKELVWENKDYSSFYYFFEFVIVGNYMYTTFDHYLYEDGYITYTVLLSEDENKERYYMRIDVTNGDCYYIRPE